MCHINVGNTVQWGGKHYAPQEGCDHQLNFALDLGMGFQSPDKKIQINSRLYKPQEWSVQFDLSPLRLGYTNRWFREASLGLWASAGFLYRKRYSDDHWGSIFKMGIATDSFLGRANFLHMASLYVYAGKSFQEGATVKGIGFEAWTPAFFIIPGLFTEYQVTQYHASTSMPSDSSLVIGVRWSHLILPSILLDW